MPLTLTGTAENWNAPTQQDRVDDYHGARILEMSRSVFCQERMALEVAIRAPVNIPAGVHEHGFSADVEVAERGTRDGGSLPCL